MCTWFPKQCSQRCLLRNSYQLLPITTPIIPADELAVLYVPVGMDRTHQMSGELPWQNVHVVVATTTVPDHHSVNLVQCAMHHKLEDKYVFQSNAHNAACYKILIVSANYSHYYTTCR